jgi:hypothetical protein
VAWAGTQSAGESGGGASAGGIVDAPARRQLSKFDKIAQKREVIGEKLLKKAFPGNISAWMKKRYAAAKSAKEPMEQDLLKAQRQRNAEYEPALLGIINETGGSADYMPITADKCRALLAWIADVMMTNARPWSLHPTPIPDLQEEAVMAIKESVIQDVSSGVLPPENAYEAGSIYADYLNADNERQANDRASKMEDTIADQITESNFDVEFRAFLDDFVTYPTAVFAGPFVRPKQVLSWEGNKPIVKQELKLMFERISPFDVYPSPTMRNFDESYFFIRQVVDRQYIHDLRPLPGFSSGMIDHVLMQPPKGTVGDSADDQERNELEDRPDQQMSEAADDQVTILKYWGTARGRDLVEWGRSDTEIADPEKMYEIEAWMIGDFVIRAVLNPDPLGRRSHYSTSYEKKPGSFWGHSVPDRMAPIQDIINSACRALVNNMSITSGPQILVNRDALPPGTDILSHQAFRVWPYQAGYASNSSGKPPVEFYQPQSTVDKLMQVFQYFRELADDASGIPRYVHGNSEIGGAGSTASGLSMLLGASARGVKLAIYNIDLDVMQKVIDKMFTFNMLHNPDPSIKGDVSIVSAGALALLNRDHLQARRQEFADRVNNPMDHQIIGVEERAVLLRQIGESLEFKPGVIPSQKELVERLARMAQAATEQDPAGEQLTQEGA